MELVIIPIVIIFLSQALKLLTDGIKGNFDLTNIYNTYGGMPSTHTAFITSLGILIAIKDGLDSTSFAIWFILAVVVIRDALGLRQEVSRHSQAIKKIVKGKDISIPPLNTRVGHKPKEVIAGFLFGITATLIIKFLIL
ncbi:divergent PAP2 family protein [Candidatus Falkowbacteria bacterium]|jgi:uncharacterized protein|nr:divergent PAP2 family protein [Candidatus Falkowbacteria bacterium]MBT4433082.1 divergent PAP2 family protein [Candidatus Falkowbacteria bacterium]